ncbi:MAG: SMC-Scp complex subunit ScpB [Clostridia bacterium]|nr:SMC-Scp complex subunit ScpB [Clostridia bacterium]
MKVQQLQAAAEAILFAAGEPLERARIAEALELDEEYTEKILDRLAAELDERESGVCLLRMEDQYQLCTRTQFADVIRGVLEVKKNAPLSPAAFEVLAVVAYNQPVTKSYIEQVRGVDCSSVLNTLCLKGLVEEKGRLELPGRPLLYGTTPEFLKCFCMSSLTELPELPEQDLPRLEDVVQDDAQPEAQEPAPPEEAAVDEDQYTFYDVPEDGDDLYTLPDA